jgi:hypothetical protein
MNSHAVTGMDRGTRRIGKHVELDNLRNDNNDPRRTVEAGGTRD